MGVAGFVAADLGDVQTDAVGEGLLGEALLFAERHEAVGEVHVSEHLDEGGGFDHRDASLAR